jgi:hypothetical protein
MDETQMDLLNNKTIANPTNRQPSAIKGDMSEIVSKTSKGYTLRSNRRRVNYRERSESRVSSVSSRKMIV